MESARICCRPKHRHCFADSSIIHWFLSKNMIGTKPHVPNWILCKAAGLNRRPFWGKGCSPAAAHSKSISTVTSEGCAQKLGNDVRRDSESKATKVCSQICSKQNALLSHVVAPLWCDLGFVPNSRGNKAVANLRPIVITDQRWQDELQFSIWRFFGQSVYVNIHLLCYWPTTIFQNISSHFF